MSPHRDLPECSGDAAAYVLGALSPEETAAFERHLETCVVCRDEIAAFSEVIDVMPLTVPQHAAPRALRRRIRRAARATAADRPAGQPATTTGTAPWRTRTRTRARIGILAAAGALAAAIVVVAVLTLGGGGHPARTIQASVVGPGRAEVRLVDGHAELVVRGVPAPPAGDVYEVWLQRGGAAPQPTRTLFGVTADGAADVGVTGSMSGVSRMLVTPERAGGSQHPTHAPVIIVSMV
jgi:anti-sigma factor RsiW